MDSGRAGTAAGFETTVFLSYFNEMPGPRQRGKVTYRLDEILLLALLATLAGAEGFADIARFGLVPVIARRSGRDSDCSASFSHGRVPVGGVAGREQAAREARSP
jgi:hypothetical protein